MVTWTGSGTGLGQGILGSGVIGGVGGLWGLGSTTTAPPPPRKPYRKTNFEKAVEGAKTRTTHQRWDEWSVYTIKADDLIEIMGNVRPLYKGRPQVFMFNLLNAVPSNYRPPSKRGRAIAHTLAYAGLLTYYPGVYKKKRQSFRITMAGLMLLDHWAVKHPKFKPFLDAYCTAKARREILSFGVDLSMGTLPKALADAVARHEQGLKHRAADEMLKHQLSIDHARMAAIYQSALTNSAKTVAQSYPFSATASATMQQPSLVSRVKKWFT